MVEIVTRRFGQFGSFHKTRTSMVLVTGGVPAGQGGIGEIEYEILAVAYL